MWFELDWLGFGIYNIICRCELICFIHSFGGRLQTCGSNIPRHVTKKTSHVTWALTYVSGLRVVLKLWPGVTLSKTLYLFVCPVPHGILYGGDLC